MGRQQRIPGQPKGPKSAYLFFCDSERSKLKESHPGAGIGEIGKLMGEAWKAIDADAKTKFEELAKADKERYETEKAAFVPPPQAELPKGWSESTDPTTGRTYYYNMKSKESRWERPTDSKTAGGKKEKKKEKDPNAPKQPKTAYFFFMDTVRAKVKEENPTASIGELGKLMGAAWAALGDAKKDEFKALAEKDKVRHAAEKADYEAKKTLEEEGKDGTKEDGE